jgi:hypothetical protein
LILEEKQLRFDFTGCIRAEKYDENPAVPNLMKKVDFLVEEPNRILLVEVKNVLNPGTGRADREKFIRELKSKKLIYDGLVPKCRDSWAFLHLMALDNKPIYYAVVIDLYPNNVSPELFGPLMNALAKRLRKESTAPWKRPYVCGSAILSLVAWNQEFPNYRASRIQP